jgi:hypothetical protein
MTMIISGSTGLEFPDGSDQTIAFTGNAAAITSGVLAQANGGTGTTIGYNGFKNRIINGQMVLDQRNAGASVTPTNAQYLVDRWQAGASAASKFSVQQNAGSVTPPVGFTKYLGCTSLSAYSIGASDTFRIQQAIEGFNIADLGWGTANAKTVTLSFQVYSSLTGTFGGSIYNGSGARSYPFIYSIPVANTWTTVSVTIAGDTSGTWATDNSAGLYVTLSLGAGSTYSATAGSWASGFYLSATGATSVVGTNGATFYITGVQLEKGSTATSFDYRPYGTELVLCQRYFEKISGVFLTNSNTYLNYYYKVTKRVSPTFSNLQVDGGTGGTLSNYVSLDRTYQETAHSVPSNFTSWASAEL